MATVKSGGLLFWARPAARAQEGQCPGRKSPALTFAARPSGLSSGGAMPTVATVGIFLWGPPGHRASSCATQMSLSCAPIVQ